MTSIAIVAGSYVPQACGVAHYTKHLREELGKYNFQSIVLTTTQAAEIAVDPTVKGVVADWTIASLPSLAQAVQAANCDILHIQHAAGTYGFARAIFLLPLLLKIMGWQGPIITTVHEYGWWEWQPTWLPPRLLEAGKMWGQKRHWWDREDGFLLTCSNAIITTNQAIVDILCDRLPNRRCDIHCVAIGPNIPVALDPPQTAKAEICRQFGWPPAVTIFAFFGFIHPVKGLEVLLAAFQQVVLTHPEARLLLMGGVESLALPAEAANQYRTKLQDLIHALQLTESVKMTGYLEADQASHYLSSVDVGVLPFHHGVTLKSGSLLALMTHALPVIATLSAPPEPELLGVCGVRLIPPCNINALVAELNLLLENVDLRQQWGRAAKTWSGRFAWSTITQAHLGIYQSVL